MLLIAALALVAYLLWKRRRQLALAAELWRDELATTIAAAKTAGDQLRDAAGGPIDPDRLESLRHEADAVAAALARLSTSAPDDNARVLTDAAEKALRGYTLAIDGEQLLRTQSPAASEDALADANVTRRARGDEFDRALTALETLQPTAPADPAPSP